MNKKGLHNFVCIILFMTALFLTSCAKEEPLIPEINKGKYPVSFTAQKYSETLSRASADNIWDGDEHIAVKFGDINPVKQYQVSPDGKLTCTAPFYWENKNPVTVTAWYPYSTEQPMVFTVKTDQSGTGYEESDMLMACSEVIPRNSSLSFTHLPAKVVINIKGDENTGDVSGASISIINVAATSGTITTGISGKITVGQPELLLDMTIIPQEVAPVTAGYEKTVKAMLVPQNKDNSQFIRITLNGKDCYYTPATGEANITAGNLYTYNITVKGPQKNVETKSFHSRAYSG